MALAGIQQNRISEHEVELRVSGALRGSAATEFQGWLRVLVAAPYQLVTVNLRECPAINSSSIGAMVATIKRLGPERSLRVADCPISLLAKFQNLKLDKLLEISPMEE